MRWWIQIQEQENQKNKKEKKMASGDQMKDRHRQVILIKRFKNYEDKIIYRGTQRKARKLIPPSKKDQYEIIFIKPLKENRKWTI